MSRIPFTDALTSLVEGLAMDRPVRSVEVAVDIPIEVDVVDLGNGLEFLAHPRRWRLPTAFDERPGRLQFRYELTNLTSPALSDEHQPRTAETGTASDA